MLAGWLAGIDLMRSQCKAIDSKSLCLCLKSEKVPPATCAPIKANARYSHTISLKTLTKALEKSVFSHLFVYIYRIHVSAFDGRERANAVSSTKKVDEGIGFVLFGFCVTFGYCFSMQYRPDVAILLCKRETNAQDCINESNQGYH